MTAARHAQVVWTCVRLIDVEVDFTIWPVSGATQIHWLTEQNGSLIDATIDTLPLAGTVQNPPVQGRADTLAMAVAGASALYVTR